MNKKSCVIFIFTELCIFMSQVFVIFLVAVFTSDFLRSESRLSEFSETKINSHTLEEFGLTLFAITSFLGLLTIISKMISSKFVEDIINKILQELPRTIYFFGSSITAVAGAITVFVAYHPESSTQKSTFDFAIMTTFFAISFFVYGCGLKALLYSKSHKLKNKNPVKSDLLTSTSSNDN